MAEQEEVLEQAGEGTEAAQPQSVEIGEGENFSRQQVEEIVKSALDKEITGLKANNSALKEEKKKAQAKATNFSEMIASLGGEEGVQKLAELKMKIDQDEELRLFTSGDREKYNARILGRAQQDHAAQIKSMKEERDSWQQAATSAIERFRLREIDKSILDGCADAGVNPRLYKAMSAQIKDDVVFDPETEKVLVKDGDGVRYGKDGAPMQVTELIETMRDEQPELFLKSTGSGAVGSTMTRRGASITMADIGNMSVEEYRKHRDSGAIK